jgi:predicted AAA+ superfamily ATPase
MEMNEQSLSMSVENLEGGEARAVFKNTKLDLNMYKRIKMFVHTQNKDNQEGIASVFVRLGTDLKSNYYEIEIPNLKNTVNGSQDAFSIWPKENELDIPLDLLRNLKLERNRNMFSMNQKYGGDKLVDCIESFGDRPVSLQMSESNISRLSEVKRSLILEFQSTDDWTQLLPELANYYKHSGTGIFTDYDSFRWCKGHLEGIAYPDLVQLSDLIGYESQRQTLYKNTEAFLAGYHGLHTLLYGSRGSGKSSMVKSLMYAYRDRGLRLVEVAKNDLKDLPIIAEILRRVPQKFIIFVDDLSFEEESEDYKALKVVLEGTLSAQPNNLLVYATSNRRHLLREYFSDRPSLRDLSDNKEVNPWDTMQEKLSLSDRFGLTLTFLQADQEIYLKIVHHLAKRAGIDLLDDDLNFRALQWATRHNGQSGRTAQQFIDFLQADLELKR